MSATVGPSFAIVNSTVNDVAMTVLPDAPIDPATGLPVPTIAVATAGGISVIRDDGNVWDITNYAKRLQR
jgi:trimeric autotransporter adhesin